MKDIRFDGQLDYKIDKLGFVKVMRNAGFEFSFRSGKDRHSLIVVQNGSIKYRFINTNETVTLTKGTLFFIPKKYPYIAKYLEELLNQKERLAENLRIKGISADSSENALLESISIQACHFQRSYPSALTDIASGYRGASSVGNNEKLTGTPIK